ncbi:acyl-CoA dehydrogenase/oxidase [Pavlovales sp. CCMP2436]|nr:acyl-CoA dehydrogenase/oxidase [Pavlovales sp. CCMP2436]
MATSGRSEVARHNSARDALLIIDDKVYDVTKFAAMHPGGDRFLLELAGHDATRMFYSLHRKEVLEKFGEQLLVGTLAGSEPQADPDSNPLLSRVPFAENLWQREAHSSPYYTDSHRRFQQAVRGFMREIQSEADQSETEGRVPTADMFRKLGDFGLLACRIGPLCMAGLPKGTRLPGAVLPSEFDYFHEQIAHEEMGVIGTPSFTDGLGGGMVIGLPPVLQFGRPKLAQRVAAEVLSGRRQIALAISEPFAGSDVAAIKTTATKSTDGRHYVVNGLKKWITNGTFAHYFVTAVRTGGEGMRGISLLLIERGEGVTTEQIKVMYGSSAGTALVTLDGVKVPVENLLGEENGGFRCIMYNFNHERWLICCGVLRGTRAMLEECFKWAHQRETFGDKLTDKPVIRAKLARMAAGVDAAHAWLECITFQMTKMTYAEQAAYLAGPTALHKLLTTRTATMVADEACQIFGGRALTQTGMGRFCERFWRTVKFGAILGGSEEIMADLGIRQALRNYPPQARL